MVRAFELGPVLVVAMAAAACTDTRVNVVCPFVASEKWPKGRDMAFGGSFRDVVNGLQDTSHEVEIEWTDSDTPQSDRFTWSWRLRRRPERGQYSCRIGQGETGESNDEIVRGPVLAQLDIATGATGTGTATFEIDPLTGNGTVSGTVTLVELSGTRYADFDLNDDRLDLRFDASVQGFDPIEGTIRTSNPSRRVGTWQR